MSQRTSVIYLPSGPDASERWEVVAAALRAAGISDIRPAPMPAQTYTPRMKRPTFISSMEV